MCHYNISVLSCGITIPLPKMQRYLTLLKKKTCYCRQKTNCTLWGNCLANHVVCVTTVTSNNTHWVSYIVLGGGLQYASIHLYTKLLSLGWYHYFCDILFIRSNIRYSFDCTFETRTILFCWSWSVHGLKGQERTSATVYHAAVLLKGLYGHLSSAWRLEETLFENSESLL